MHLQFPHRRFSLAERRLLFEQQPVDKPKDERIDKVRDALFDAKTPKSKLDAVKEEMIALYRDTQFRANAANNRVEKFLTQLRGTLAQVGSPNIIVEDFNEIDLQSLAVKMGWAREVFAAKLQEVRERPKATLDTMGKAKWDAYLNRAKMIWIDRNRRDILQMATMVYSIAQRMGFPQVIDGFTVEQYAAELERANAPLRLKSMPMQSRPMESPELTYPSWGPRDRAWDDTLQMPAPSGYGPGNSAGMDGYNGYQHRAGVAMRGQYGAPVQTPSSYGPNTLYIDPGQPALNAVPANPVYNPNTEAAKNAIAQHQSRMGERWRRFDNDQRTYINQNLQSTQDYVANADAKWQMAQRVMEGNTANTPLDSMFVNLPTDNSRFYGDYQLRIDMDGEPDSLGQRQKHTIIIHPFRPEFFDMNARRTAADLKATGLVIKPEYAEGGMPTRLNIFFTKPGVFNVNGKEMTVVNPEVKQQLNFFNEIRSKCVGEWKPITSMGYVSADGKWHPFWGFYNSDKNLYYVHRYDTNTTMWYDDKSRQWFTVPPPSPTPAPPTSAPTPSAPASAPSAAPSSADILEMNKEQARQIEQLKRVLSALEEQVRRLKEGK